MRKLAIFVEGQTEQIFLVKLIQAVAGANRIAINKVRARGGRRSGRTITQIEAVSHVADEAFYVQLCDCGCDNKVAADIREQYAALSRDFVGIIGVRDLHPIARTDLCRLVTSMRSYMKNEPVRVQLIVAVMETEAWFLGETTHFGRIHPSLTTSAVEAILCFDPSAGNIEDRLRPSKDLDNVYSRVGKNYAKDRNTVQDTINALDYGRMRVEVSTRLPSLRRLVCCLEFFFKGGDWLTGQEAGGP